MKWLCDQPEVLDNIQADGAAMIYMTSSNLDLDTGHQSPLTSIGPEVTFPYIYLYIQFNNKSNTL